LKGLPGHIPLTDVRVHKGGKRNEPGILAEAAGRDRNFKPASEKGSEKRRPVGISEIGGIGIQKKRNRSGQVSALVLEGRHPLINFLICMSA